MEKRLNEIAERVFGAGHRWENGACTRPMGEMIWRELRSVGLDCWWNFDIVSSRLSQLQAFENYPGGDRK